jgi:class 3 adenylate cyclase
LTTADRLRSFARDFFTPLGEPFADARRYSAAHRLHLAIGPTLVLGPTAWVYATSPVFRSRPQLVRAIDGIWFPAAALFTALVLAGSLMGTPEEGSRRQSLQRLLFLVAIVPMIATNHATSWMLGTLTNPATAIFVALIAGYRVFLDYASAMVVAVVSLVGFVGIAGLELAGVIRAQPFLADPTVNPTYGIPEVGTTMLTGALTFIGLTFCATNYGMNQRLKLHRYITRSVLRRYLPESLVHRAERGEFDVEGKPERRTVTVMFTDLVGFTGLSERLGAEAVGEVLNTYLRSVARLAHEHGATVDKFIGDAVMVVVGAPEPLDPGEQARRAAALARAVHAEVAALDVEVELQARSGINTGEAVVGNFGSEVRSDYTVIGPAVNIAARLEAASEPGRILVGETTAELLEEDLESAGEFRLKGVSEPVAGYFLPLTG